MNSTVKQILNEHFYNDISSIIIDITNNIILEPHPITLILRGSYKWNVIKSRLRRYNTLISYPANYISITLEELFEGSSYSDSDSDYDIETRIKKKIKKDQKTNN